MVSGDSRVQSSGPQDTPAETGVGDWFASPRSGGIGTRGVITGHHPRRLRFLISVVGDKGEVEAILEGGETEAALDGV